MPRRTHRRKSRRSKRAKPRSRVDKNLDRRIKKIEQEVEVKHVATVTNVLAIPFDGANPYWGLLCVNPLSIGVGNGLRIGTDVTSKMLQIRLRISGDSLSPTDGRVRIVIFWYKNARLGQPNPAQLFELGAANIVPPITFAFKNTEYEDNFKVIYDRTHVLKPLDWNGTTTVIPEIFDINKGFRLGRKVKYDPVTTAGTFADITDNSLWISFTTSLNSAAYAGAAQPTITASARFHYTDA